MFQLILVFAAIVFANFLFACAEVALSAFGENKIEDLKENNDRRVKYFEKLNEDHEVVFGTIQFIITFLNVLISITGYFLSYFTIIPLVNSGVYSESAVLGLSFFAATLIITLIILIFVVLIPKAIGYKYSNGIGKFSVKPVLLIAGGFKYLIQTATIFSNLILAPFKERVSFSREKPSEDEILDIISDGVMSGSIDVTEQEIIENVLEFNDLRANEVMIPRTEMVAIDINASVEENLELIVKTGYSLIPVYEDSLDNIIGILHTKDVMKNFLAKKEFSVKDLIRPSYFVPETKSISEILKEMQKQGERIAIVTDEYGGTEGVITVEDILEEIVGELKDKTRSEIQSISKAHDGKYYILGSLDISEFNESFNIQLPDSDEYNTIAGFVADKTGKILNPGEVFEYGDLEFELIKKIRQKMVQFRVHSVKNELIRNEAE